MRPTSIVDQHHHHNTLHLISYLTQLATRDSRQPVRPCSNRHLLRRDVVVRVVQVAVRRRRVALLPRQAQRHAQRTAVVLGAVQRRGLAH